MNRLTNAPQRSYQICGRCVMDTSDPWIQFHADGTCNHCSDFLSNRLEVTAFTNPEGQADQLGALLEQLRPPRQGGGHAAPLP